MNKDQLMNHPDITTFPGEKRSIVKAWVDGGDMAVLTKDGCFFCLRNNKWHSYQPGNFGDFVLVSGRAMALSKEGYLFIHHNLNYLSNLKFAPVFEGIIFVEIAIHRDGQSIALDKEGLLYVFGTGNGYVRYEMDWSSHVAEKPEDWTGTQVLIISRELMVLASGGKIFIPMEHAGMGCRQENKDRKLKIIGETLRDKKVVDLAAGQNLIFALTDSGELYKWSKINIGKKPPEIVDYKCHKLPFRGIKLCAIDNIDLLLVFLGPGMVISIRFSGDGEIRQKCILTSESAFNIFKSIGIPFYGCLYNAVNKWNAELKISWIKKSLSMIYFMKASDLVIEVDGKQIACHQSIVSAHCEFLKNWIKNESMKKKTDKNLRLCVNGFKYPAIRTILNYIYTGKLSFDSFDVLLELIELTEIWLEKELQKFLVGEAIQQLSAVNVYLAREIADRLDLQDLKRACLFYPFTLPPLVIS